MAELTNGRNGAAHLAAHLDVLRSDERPGPVIHGPVFTFGSGKDMCWLRLAFWVGERMIYEQEILVQWPSIRNWPDEIEYMVVHETKGVSFGSESPELFVNVEQLFIEPEIRDDPDKAHGYTLLIGVDTSISAGLPTVSGEGPCMFFFVELDQLRQFARDLKSEARFARLLKGLDAADFDYGAAGNQMPFLDEGDDT